VRVSGDVTNSQIVWDAALNLSTGPLTNAQINIGPGSPTSINVPGGISDAAVNIPANGPPLTTVTYQAIAGNLTTLTTQGAYQGGAWVGPGGGLTPLVSTTTALAASDTFTSTLCLVGGLRQVVGGVYSDQSGTLEIQQSPDGQNWDVVSSIAYTGGTNTGGFEVDVVEPFARIVYVNGATAQTVFRLYAWGKPS
jgi:hypothetical protein